MLFDSTPSLERSLSAWRTSPSALNLTSCIPTGALDNAFAAIRAVGFYLTTIAIAVPLFHVMLWLAPVVLLTDKFKRSAMHVVNDLWANLTSLLWYPIDLQGAENLPPRDTPVVYVANHQVEPVPAPPFLQLQLRSSGRAVYTRRICSLRSYVPPESGRTGFD